MTAGSAQQAPCRGAAWKRLPWVRLRWERLQPRVFRNATQGQELAAEAAPTGKPLLLLLLHHPQVGAALGGGRLVAAVVGRGILAADAGARLRPGRAGVFG